MSTIQAKVCPFGISEITDILVQDSESGALTPPVDELIWDQLAQFLLQPVRQQFWNIFIESSQRTSTKGSAKDNAQTEKDAER